MTWGSEQRTALLNSFSLVQFLLGMSDEDKPFKAEYAKSGRSACKQCKGLISKGILRMAKMVQVNTIASKNILLAWTAMEGVHV